MKAPSIANRIALFLACTLMLVLSGTLAWGVVLDYQARGIVSNGVTVAGRDLSGMTEAQARAAIEEAVSVPMLRPVTITGDKKTWRLDPAGIVQVDIDAMLASAYSPRQTATFVERLGNELADMELPADIEPAYTVDSAAIASWVAQTATQVDRKPVNATRKIVKYKFKIKKSVPGASVIQTAAIEQIAQALQADSALASANRVVELPVKSIKPKLHEKDFKTAIIVSISQCRIRLYKGAKLVKSYPCAPGTYSYPTPIGDFKIKSKQRYAPWINPGSAWAANMPRIIPGGPGNPMGTTKIGITWPGVFMHGVPPGEYGSIGRRASHGCMRMMPAAVLDLYGRVKIGDPVYIRP